MFRRVLIANRGEIACRIIRACRALGVAPVAVYSDADIAALHVRQADESFRLGPPAPTASYLDQDRIIEVAVSAGVDALHPGYGFLSENAAFADRCTAAGITFIGPPAAAMRALGDKLAARRTAHGAGVPTLPGSPAVADPEAARRAADEIGYPVLVKASGGGGGRGMRVVNAADEVARAFDLATGEAASSFGNPTVYIEKYLGNPRHVEVQILGDRTRVLALGERECSIQRRHQKLLEESPSPGITPVVRDELLAAARALGRTAGYTNAGTCEFLVQDGRFFFLEVNARIQVEHPVTEMVTGVDLVQWQLRIAAGEELTLRPEDLRTRGHAIEVRINAEDAESEFAPSPGTLTYFEPPEGDGIRVDTGVGPGSVVTPYYDSLIAKLIVWGESRPAALATLRVALGRFTIRGVRHLIPFFQDLADDPGFREGETTTGFLGTFRRPDREEERRVAAGIGALALTGTLRATAMSPARSRWRSEGRRRSVERLPDRERRAHPRWSPGP